MMIEYRLQRIHHRLVLQLNFFFSCFVLIVQFLKLKVRFYEFMLINHKQFKKKNCFFLMFLQIHRKTLHDSLTLICVLTCRTLGAPRIYGSVVAPVWDLKRLQSEFRLHGSHELRIDFIRTLRKKQTLEIKKVSRAQFISLVILWQMVDPNSQKLTGLNPLQE